MNNTRVLALLGDSITTDHISPAGAISPGTPAANYLGAKGIHTADFNTYGSRRGNHEVMARGTFANIRLKNKLTEGKEGGWTVHLPDGNEMSIFDAAELYQAEKVPLIVIAGKEYGTGSSRDWAAKGPRLLGVKAILAESFERIHRSNLVGMGIAPLRFQPGQNASTLGLSGKEIFTLEGFDRMAPDSLIQVIANLDGNTISFQVTAMVHSDYEVECLRRGGIFQMFDTEIVRG
jgi:aconitate hydratase